MGLIEDCVHVCICVCMHARSAVFNCDPMDWSILGSSDYGIFQTRILEQVAFSYFRGTS